jgi:hypothetical protein
MRWVKKFRVDFPQFWQGLAASRRLSRKEVGGWNWRRPSFAIRYRLE